MKRKSSSRQMQNSWKSKQMTFLFAMSLLEQIHLPKKHLWNKLKAKTNWLLTNITLSVPGKLQGLVRISMSSTTILELNQSERGLIVGREQRIEPPSKWNSTRWVCLLWNLKKQKRRRSKSMKSPVSLKRNHEMLPMIGKII